jgi:RHS repeat-associated protein
MQHPNSRYISFSLIIFLLLSQTLFAGMERPENNPGIANELLLNEPSCFVNSVNVITGHYQENAIDLEVAGPHPLYFQRSYSSGHGGGSLCSDWSSNHYGKASIPSRGNPWEYNDPTGNNAPWELDSKGKIIRKTKVCGNFGLIIPYKGSKRKTKNAVATFKIDEELFQKYVTNCGDQKLSPGNHVRNNQFFFIKENNQMVSLTGNGYKRYYQTKANTERSQCNNKVTNFSLSREDHPHNYNINYTNKNIILRNSKGNDLSYIQKIHLYKDPKTKQVDTISQLVGSDGKWVKYHYSELRKGDKLNLAILQLNCVEGSHIPTQTYEYYGGKIIRKNLPEGRFLCNRYITATEAGSSKDPRVGRVVNQSAPVGVDATPIYTHSYDYQLRVLEDDNSRNDKIPLGGYTSVYDAHQNRTDYHFNDDYRIVEIHKWREGNASIHSIERSYWGENNTPNSTNLISRSLANGQNEIKLCRSYVYDQNGNATIKLLWGNLTGRNPSNIYLSPEGVPYPFGECFAKTYTYYTGSLDLLLSESDEKKTTEYHYLPNTSLNAIKFVKVNNNIQKREFILYDDNSCIQSIIFDDGSSAIGNDLSNVTEQHITNILNRPTAPIGLPQIVDQRYLDFDTNQQILLGRVVNTHSPTGEIVKQEHYDSEYVLKFTLEWEYDSMGNLIMEKDALGRTVIRRYDLNKNLVYEEGPLPGVSKEFRYDFVNRLIGTTETHPDGMILNHSFRYDFLGNKIASVDPYGQETRYVYDNLNRLIATICPTVLNENMVPVLPTTLIEYDLFNNPCRITDPAGGVTTIFYTAYNKPYFKHYPDGTAEAFEYDLTGNMIKSVAQNGTTTFYQYDAFDRLIKKDIYSLQNEFVQTESNTYNAFHLLSKTDPLGNTTNYQYDKAGRLVLRKKNGIRIQHEYDTSGRESKVLTFHGANDDEYTTSIKEYDLLNRVIEERVEDSSGNILTKQIYGYDLAGNRNLICTYNQAGKSNTFTEYNTRGQPTLITTALGEETRFHYRYDYYDPELGQNLPYCESIDPKGVVTVCIKDALGRNKTEYKKDPFGQLLQKRNYYYTAKGLLGRTVNEVIIDGKCQSNLVNICIYNAAGQLIEIYESEGDPKQKITKFQYNSFGQKSVEIKPDGTSLHYSYDALGRLKEYHASDRSFHYSYEYDANSNLTRIFDQIHETETVKVYDKNDRLIKETLANGLSLGYTYDLSGKPIKMTFPDGSGMSLSYESLFLKEITRLDSQGKALYSHVYNSYDLSGNVTESSLIGNAGKMSYSIDLNGRLTGITSDVWTGSIQNYDLNGNVSNKTFEDPLGAYPCEYAYDALDQLIEEKGDFFETYANDSLYNRIKKGNLDYAVNALNQVINDGRNRYEYDLNGNLIFIDDGLQEIKLYYDALNRLMKVEKNNQQISYIYDPMNRRISKTISFKNEFSDPVSKTFNYLYQDLNEIGCYEDGKITELRLLGIGKGAEISAAVAMEFNGIAYAPIHDTQGNVVCLVDAESGEAKEFYRYSAFGEESLYDQDGNPLQKAAAINPWRFSSKRTDSETGFIYFGRRYYDSNLGRWITPDPIGFEGGPNLYAYVMNNPLTNIDLYGLCAEDSSQGVGSERGFMSSVRDFFVSAYEGIRDCLASLGGAVIDGVSLCTEYLDRFCASSEDRMSNIPIRYVAVVSARIGALTDEIAFGFTNGVNNTLLEANSNAEFASMNAGRMDFVYNLTRGLPLDVCRAAAALFLFMPSRVVFELHRRWDRHFEKYGERPYLQGCHSEGAINVRNALMCYDVELRKMIDVLAIAPAAYIDPRMCRNVYHYVSTRDFVPWFDFEGRMMFNETVHVLQAHKDAKFWDHDFQSPTYSAVIKYHINKHIKDNGY